MKPKIKKPLVVAKASFLNSQQKKKEMTSSWTGESNWQQKPKRKQQPFICGPKEEKNKNVRTEKRSEASRTNSLFSFSFWKEKKTKLESFLLFF
jgi:hypothetical protein